jgi:hypothetical protein
MGPVTLRSLCGEDAMSPKVRGLYSMRRSAARHLVRDDRLQHHGTFPNLQAYIYVLYSTLA